MSSHAYLNSLPKSLTPAQRAWQEAYFYSMPERLQTLVDRASMITEVRADTIGKGIAIIDNTSLQASEPMVGGESDDSIRALAGASHKFGAAATCVFPNHTTVAKDASHGTPVAVVHDFEHGQMTREQAVATAHAAIGLGANEVDTVMNYREVVAGKTDAAREKLTAVFNTVRAGGALLKTILKSIVYQTDAALRTAAHLAIDAGTNFIKSGTGKEPLPGYGPGGPDVANLMIMATLLDSVRESGRTDIGVKIAGGIRTALDFEKLRFLSDAIMGEDFFKPSTLRVGSSGALPVLVGQLSTAPSGY